MAGFSEGKPILESDAPLPGSTRKSETAARFLIECGVKVGIVRLPPSVHGIRDHGFLSILIRHAREAGFSAYLNEGQNRWSGVHRDDAAKVYLLALEQGVTESVYHAVAEEGVPFRQSQRPLGISSDYL